MCFMFFEPGVEVPSRLANIHFATRARDSVNASIVVGILFVFRVVKSRFQFLATSVECLNVGLLKDLSDL